MTTTWTSGTRSKVLCTVCPGDLIAVHLTSGSTAERADANGRPPHLVFVPEFDHRAPNKIGGSAPDARDPNEWRLGLAPTFFQFHGQLYLDGGVGVAYAVSFTRSCCRSAPIDDVMTLRSINTTAVPLPRDTYAISVPRDSDIELVAWGDTATFTLVADHVLHLGHMAQGTIRTPGATALELVNCYVRR